MCKYEKDNIVYQIPFAVCGNVTLTTDTTHIETKNAFRLLVNLRKGVYIYACRTLKIHLCIDIITYIF